MGKEKGRKPYTVTTERKITKTDRQWYQLGLLNGEARLDRTLNVMKAANKALWDELCRLDKEMPVTGVLVPFKMANSIIIALTGKSKSQTNIKASTYLARKLRNLRTEARKDGNDEIIDIQSEPGPD